jgi:hypothetical protein
MPSMTGYEPVVGDRTATPGEKEAGVDHMAIRSDI